MSIYDESGIGGMGTALSAGHPEMSTDELAEKLVSGQVSCEGCGSLAQLIENVRNNKIPMEDFKAMLNDAKTQNLRGVV
jgi:hypothetical protein